MLDLLSELIVAAFRARPSLDLPSINLLQIVLGTIVLPLTWWIVGEIGSAVIGHRTLKALADETCRAEQVLAEAVDSLRAENARLASVNDAVIAQNIELQKVLRRVTRTNGQKRKPRPIAQAEALTGFRFRRGAPSVPPTRSPSEMCGERRGRRSK